MNPSAVMDNTGEQAERTDPNSLSGPQAVTYGSTAERASINIDLPEELQQALLQLTEIAQEQDLYQRRLEVIRDRKNRFYERGMQHVYADIGTGLFVAGSPGGWVPDGNDREVQCSNYVDDYPIFPRALQIIIAKLTENPVGITWEPDSGKPGSVDLQAAQAGEAYEMLFNRRNDSKDLLTAIVRMYGVSGRTITWTRTIADKQRWGTDEQGQPVESEICSVFGTLESKVPILASTIQDWPYCILSKDPHILTAKMEHPLFADKITEQGDDGIADTQFERMCRIGALQGNTASFQVTDTYNHYVERKYVFFRPAMFMEKCLDTAFEGGTLRDALQAAFPDGCQVTFIGKQYVGSINNSMDDCLTVDFPYAGDGMARMAIMDPAVIIQDRFNDDMNLYAEWKDFGSPDTWVRAGYAEVSAINDQTASPFAFRAALELTSILKDRALADNFHQEKAQEIPPTWMQHTEYLATQLLQFILAIPSAVQGAGMPDQKTASGYNAALTQAMGQLGVIWGAVQRQMSGVMRQAAILASKRDPKTIVIPGPKGATTLNTADLGKGHFLTHPDVDSGYPESTMQIRATLTQLLTMAAQDPAVLQAILQSPDNWDFIFRTYGVDLTIPEAVVRRKQLAEIEELLEQAPMMPSPEEIAMAQQKQQTEAMVQHAADTMTSHASGMPRAPFDPNSVQPIDPMSLAKSSITPDPLDFHPWEFEECREFLSDYPRVQQELAKGNELGIQNVRLHAQEHQQFIMQQAAQMAAMQPPQAPAAPKKPAPPQKPQPEAQPDQAVA